MLDEIILILFVYLISKYIGKVPQNNNIVDLGHMYIPEMPSGIISYIPLQVMSLCIPLVSYFSYNMPLRYLTLMHILRVPSYWMTQLPVLNNSEHRKYNTLLSGFAGGSCDFIWSGHASTAAYASLHIMRYYNYTILSSLLLMLYNTCLAILIIGTKNHYSVDIYIGWIVGVLFSVISK